jgi:predicted O-methyltransferase YrrM
VNVIEQVQIARRRHRNRQSLDEALAALKRDRDSSRYYARAAAAWGNPLCAPDLDYLLGVATAAAQTSGAILECGSGLTTLVLATIAPGRVVSLEHNPVWLWQMRLEIRRLGLHRSVRLLHAPLEEHGAVRWYRRPPGAECFDVVVCDGPPAHHASRYGLLPVMSDRLNQGALILLDDVARKDEAEVVRRWQVDFPGVALEPSSARYARVRYGRSQKDGS